MDQAESRPSPGQPGPIQPQRDQPERSGQPAPSSSQEPEQVAAEAGPQETGPQETGLRESDAEVPESAPLAALESSALRLQHPVIAGYDGSESSRNALAYAAGVSQRLGRPLLVVYVCSSGVYCEPLTGQVVGVPRDTEALERWLLAELDQVTGHAEVDVHVRTRRGSPARELAAAAEEFSADALVIGAPKHIWHRVAGGVSGWLARHARCPVIVVP
jgi:nucleotide-binding universal stress UspA family protein